MRMFEDGIAGDLLWGYLMRNVEDMRNQLGSENQDLQDALTRTIEKIDKVIDHTDRDEFQLALQMYPSPEVLSMILLAYEVDLRDQPVFYRTVSKQTARNMRMRISKKPNHPWAKYHLITIPDSGSNTSDVFLAPARYRDVEEFAKTLKPASNGALGPQATGVVE